MLTVFCHNLGGRHKDGDTVTERDKAVKVIASGVQQNNTEFLTLFLVKCYTNNLVLKAAI